MTFGFFPESETVRGKPLCDCLTCSANMYACLIGARQCEHGIGLGNLPKGVSEQLQLAIIGTVA